MFPASTLEVTMFAANAHRDQRRKDAKQTPYINHPLSVALRIEKSGVTDPYIIQAALLHDVLEDTTAPRKEIEDRFSSYVLALVDEVTDNKALSKSERKRKQIEHALEMSKEARIIKLADKLDNLLSLEEDPIWAPDRVLGYFVWAWFVVRNMCEYRTVNAVLEHQLEECFARNIPSDTDKDAVLAKYLESLEGVTN